MKFFGATLLAAAVLAGCGSMNASSPTSATASPDTPTRAADGTLVGPTGKTLYTFAKDTKNAGASECYDQCAVNWPPLVAPAQAKPLGDYSIIIRADGARQWAFRGMPLYYYAKDAKAGDKTGEGRGDGAWKVARP